MTQFNNRTQLFTNQPPNAKCVEVGTRYGDLAKEVLDARPDIHLVVVDSWQGKFADGEAICREKLRPYTDPENPFLTRCLIRKMDSTTVPKRLDPMMDPFDFVYIDAAHDYASVKADLEAWWPTVKSGGMMGWHDHENKPDDGFWGPIEVLSAVTDWAGALGLKINVVEAASCPSGWVVKP